MNTKEQFKAVKDFVAHNFRHFNTAVVKDSAEAYLEHLNRVTDTCIPEVEAVRRIEKTLRQYWRKAEKEGKRYFPYELFYRIIKDDALKEHYQIDPKDS